MPTTAAKGKKKSQQKLFEEPADTGIADVSKQFTKFMQPTKDNILALDIATNTGWANGTSSGYWNFTPKKDESKGMRLIRFRAKLQEFISIANVKLVVFEAVVAYGKHPNFVGAEMIGVLKLVCEDMSVEYMAYQPSSIKKWATGNGHAGKPQMIKTARDRWNMEGNNDNEADALAIFHYVLEDLGIVKPESII